MTSDRPHGSAYPRSWPASVALVTLIVIGLPAPLAGEAPDATTTPAIASSTPAPPASRTPPARYVGRRVVDVLRELQSEGLNLVFTSALVPPELIVAIEPTSGDPSRRLEQILAPHDLTTRAGPQGVRIVVVVEPAPPVQGTIAGAIEIDGGNPQPVRARIRIESLGIEFTTNEKGRFRIDLPPGSYALTASASGFVSSRLPDVVVHPDRTVRVGFALTPYNRLLESVLVRPESGAFRPDEPAEQTTLWTDDLNALPLLNDDPLLMTSGLPGVADSELKAAPHIRGGRSDELLIVLDGLELHDPYHLQDMQGGMLSIVDSTAVGRVDFFAGGFPVRYGNRMSGVVDIRTAETDEAHDSGFTIASNYARIATQGNFSNDRGRWLFSARRGYPIESLPTIVTEDRYDPTYVDLLTKVRYRLDDRSTISINLLGSNDETNESIRPVSSPHAAPADGRTIIATEYANRYGWLTLDTRWNPRMHTRSVLSTGKVDRDRNVNEVDVSAVRDQREFTFVGLRQDWQILIGNKHRLAVGFDIRSVGSNYDYATIDLGDPDVGSGSAALTTTRVRPDGTESAIYVSDTYRISEAFSAEVGLRWDRETYSPVGDETVSPRINLSFTPTPRDSLRFYWGRFHQSQRVYELQVEDGVDEFLLGETAHKIGASYRRDLRRFGVFGAAVYHSETPNPRPRFENALDPASLYPEAEEDRVRIAPDSVESAGLELSWQGLTTHGIGWRAAYTLASSDDIIDGGRVPRSWDEPQALDLALSYRLQQWSFGLAGSFHTGWPTTASFPVEFTRKDGTVDLDIGYGPRNQERLPDYRRVDLRVARDFNPGKGRLTLFADVTNLLDRKNACCTEEFDPDPDPGAPPQQYLYGLSRTYTFGVSWVF